jgi:hypothetical protein
VEKAVRIVLGIINLVLALNAFGGGTYGILGAKDVPSAWLAGSPFKSYLIPSLFLFIVVGGFCLVTSILLFRNSNWARRMCFVSGMILLAWIAAQMAIIGYVSWLQPAVAFCAASIILLAFTLEKRK